MKSIVLDLDSSISLAKDYWVGLKQALIPYMSQDTFYLEELETSLLFPLSYYNNSLKKSIIDNSIDLSKINSKSSTWCVAKEQIELFVSHGAKLPAEVIPTEPGECVEVIIKSLDLIRNVWPLGYQELKSYTNGFIIIRSDVIRSLTSPIWFGAIFLSDETLKRGDLVEVSTSILHEVGHLALYAQSALSSPLVDIGSLHYSPFKKTDRPALMVLHAQIALARMILWINNLKFFKLNMSHGEHKAALALNNVDFERADRFLGEFRIDFLEGMKSLRELTFTAQGSDLLEDFENIESAIQ